MEIIIDEVGSTKFYDEVLSVVYNHKKLNKNPKKKLYGLSINGAILAIGSLILVAVLKILSIIVPNGYYGYIGMIFCFPMVWGVIYYFKVRNKISELKNEHTTSKLIIEKNFVELVFKDKKERLLFSEIQHIIVNQHTISFIPKNGDEGIIIISSNYKNQILNAIDNDKLIIENIK